MSYLEGSQGYSRGGLEGAGWRSVNKKFSADGDLITTQGPNLILHPQEYPIINIKWTPDIIYNNLRAIMRTSLKVETNVLTESREYKMSHIQCFFQFGCYYKENDKCYFIHNENVDPEEHGNNIRNQIAICKKKLAKLYKALNLSQSRKRDELTQGTNESVTYINNIKNMQDNCKSCKISEPKDIKTKAKKSKPQESCDTEMTIFRDKISEPKDTKTKAKKSKPHESSDTEMTKSTEMPPKKTKEKSETKVEEVQSMVPTSTSTLNRIDMVMETIKGITDTITSIKSEIEHKSENGDQELSKNPKCESEIVEQVLPKSEKNTSGKSKNLRRKIRKQLSSISTEENI